MSEQNIETETEVTEDIATAELSDADLDSLIKGEPAEEGEEDASPDSSEGSEESEDKQEEQAEQANPDAEEKQDEPVDQKAQAEIARLEAKLAQQEAFIQRRNSELGSTRSKLAEALELLKGKLDEKFIESPSEGLKTKTQIDQIEGALKEIDKESESLNQVHAVQKGVAKFVPPGTATVEEMAAVMADDGMDSSVIQAFQRNPFMLGTAGTVNLAYRAKAIRERDEARAIALQLHERLQKLEGKPERLIKQISAASKQKPGLTAGSGKGATNKPTPSDPSKMSAKELDEFLEANGVRV